MSSDSDVIIADDDNIIFEFDFLYQSNKEMYVPLVIDGRYKLFKKLQETKLCAVFALTDENLVVKCIPIQYFKENSDEIIFLKEISHPNVINCIECLTFPRFTAIIMPRARTDLCEYIKYSGYQDEVIICSIMKQALEGLAYLHDQEGIWHRDIKPDNIFIMKETERGPLIQIADFGFSHKFETSEYQNAACLGTVPYAAPELLKPARGKSDFGLKFKQKARCLFYLISI